MGTIHINPKNKGKFNATKKATGKTTEELTHSSNPVTKKRAVFAQNARKWHHADGGNIPASDPPVKKRLSASDFDKLFSAWDDSIMTSQYSRNMLSGIQRKEPIDSLINEYSNFIDSNQTNKIQPIDYKYGKDVKGKDYKIPIYKPPIGHDPYDTYDRESGWWENVRSKGRRVIDSLPKLPGTRIVKDIEDYLDDKVDKIYHSFADRSSGDMSAEGANAWLNKPTTLDIPSSNPVVIPTKNRSVVKPQISKKSQSTTVKPTDVQTKSTDVPNTIKRDDRYDNLNLRDLWPFMSYADSTAKIGTLNGSEFGRNPSNGMAASDVTDPEYKNGFSIVDARKFPQEIKDKYNIDMIYNNMKQRQAGDKPVKRYNGGNIKVHAYGSKIESKWNAGDWGTMGASTASGALSGFAVGGPVGAVVGGVAGLVGGIVGSNAKAKQRAELNEQNRQTTLANMDERTQNDSLEANYDNNASMSFYLRGGRMISRRMMANGGNFIPISTDTSYVDGASHENGGVDAGPNDEVEGSEVMKNNLGTNGQVASTDVYSQRLINPQTNRPFSEDALELSQVKGKLQQKFAINEKRINHERTAVSTGRQDVLSTGSAKRRAEIAATENEQILAQIEQVDNGLKELFNVQEQVNGNAQQPNEAGEMAYGGKIQHGDGKTIRGYAHSVFGNRFDTPAEELSILDIPSKDQFYVNSYLYGNYPRHGISTLAEASDFMNENNNAYVNETYGRQSGASHKWYPGVRRPTYDTGTPPPVLEIPALTKITPGVSKVGVGRTKVPGTTLPPVQSKTGFANLPQSFKDQVAYNPSEVSMEVPGTPETDFGGYRPIPADMPAPSPWGAGTKDPTQVKEGGWDSGTKQLAFQAGAQLLDTVGQTITNAQMSKLPVPTRHTTSPALFNTYVDNSGDINDINANAAATKEFVNSNIKGAQARRNASLSIMDRTNQAKSRSFMTKFAAERDLENKNVEQMYRNTAMNNELGYQNDADKYNAAMSGLNRQSQIIGNTSDKLSQMVTAKAQLDANDQGSAMILAQFPEGVRKRIAMQLGKGRSLSTAIRIESGK